jgi:hypothetical protein
MVDTACAMGEDDRQEAVVAADIRRGRATLGKA